MGQLTVEQRYTIQILKQEGFSQKEISLRIGRDKSVVSRELSRNCDKRSGKYSADLAEKKCRKRHIEKKKRLSFTPDIQNKVEELLRTDYSPEQIVGNLKKLGVKCVSHERIYQYIWEDKKKGGVLYKHLII
jgi:IS30 family transposase